MVTTQQVERSGDFDAWASIVRAMPTPAALVDEDGAVLMANRWVDVAEGDTLLDVESGTPDSALRFTMNGGRWRTRPLDLDGSVLFATGEREDASDQLMRQFFSSGDSLFVVYDQAGLIVDSNPAWERLLGYTSDEVYGTDSWELLPEEARSVRGRVEEELRRFGKAETNFPMRTSTGEYRQIRWVLRFDMVVGKCFGVGRDITEEGRLAAELQRRAFHDELTGLANRARLFERLGEVIDAGGSPSLLFCDLDKFKVVNDSLGHQAGDDLLRELANRLSNVDLGPDTVLARFGGDEFVVLLEQGGADRARDAATQLLASLAEPIDISGRPIQLTMSIGIASGGGDSTRTADGLIGDADAAAYEAKAQGRNRWVVFDEQLRTVAARRLDLELDLRQAMASGEIEAFFQPVVSLHTGAIQGAEALVRWRRSGDLVPPGLFLDVAEDAGLLPELGSIVADQTIALAAWLAEHGGVSKMSINASDAELQVPGYCERLVERVRSAGLRPGDFLIEITESAVLAADAALPVLQSLRAAGFRLGLDDFGTGYSSLAHLRELPIDVVKVDRSFTNDLVEDSVTRALTASIVSLCGALGLEVIVEGVETEEQAEIVRQIGGDAAQGYLMHRPMPQDELKTLVLETSRGVSSPV